MVGALSNLWVGDRLGRRKTIVLGGVIMIIGAILQATSFSYAQLVVARIVTGLGNGLNVRSQICIRACLQSHVYRVARHLPFPHIMQNAHRLQVEAVS